MDNTYIRYSEAFKRKVVREVESGRFSSMHAASKAYGINGDETVIRWMRLYGDESKLSKKVRIETVEEKNELKEAKKRVRQLEEEVAGIYMDYSLPVFPNKLNTIAIDAPNKVWASDIAYLRVMGGFMYLSLTTDMYSRNIVGWNLSETMKAEDTMNALEMALTNKAGDARPVHHSDRGSQYCSHLYVGKFREHNLGIGMTEENHCAENVLAERLNGILKQEYGLRHVFASFEDALRVVEQAVWIYNHKRPHGSLGMRTPAEVHAGAVA